MISSNSDSSLSPLILRAPLRLVQIWVWERFPPPLWRNPNSVGPGESRMARWHNKQKFYITNVRSAVDSAGKSFKWCPYAMVLDNLSSPIFSVEKEEWVSVGLDLNEEIESFARCLRVCDLVGIDCTEQYLPHRVAMQFGFDQDIPGSVSSSSSNPETAWKNYSRPIGDLNFVILSRLFESHVTTRYLEWRKKSSVSTNQGVGGTNAEVSLNALGVKTKRANPDKFPSKCRRVEVKGGSNNTKDANKNKHLGDGGKPTGNDNPLVSGKSECLSPPNADSGKAELVVKAVKEEIQESEVAKGATETVGGDGADSRHGRGRNNSIWFESAAFELEARISKLEKIVAGLKASRFGNGVV